MLKLDYPVVLLFIRKYIGVVFTYFVTYKQIDNQIVELSVSVWTMIL